MKEIITKEAIQELQKALTPVVEKLGQGGEWVYKVYYKQQIVYGVQYLIGTLFGLFLFFVSYKIIKKLYKGNDTEPLIALAAFPIAFGFIFTAVCFPEAIGRLINPDYYLLQDLLSIIK